MKLSKNWKRIIAGIMTFTMVFLSVDAGCISALASEIQKLSVETKNVQGTTGYLDIGHDAGRVQDTYVGGSLSLKEEETLASSYSSVSEGYVTPVKNQSKWGVCWAFAACAAMESYALRHGYVDDPKKIDFSEYALAYLTYNDGTSETAGFTGDYTYAEDEYMDELFKSGGNDEYAFKALSNWSGIYNEADDTYYADSLESGTIEKYVENADNIDFVLTGQKYISMQDADQVKQAILENGAVSVGYYSHVDYIADADGIYNYNYEKQAQNHGVVIVGWDDNKSKDQFQIKDLNGTTIASPENDGAWLVKNSWGTWDGYDGYIWISYEDLGLLSSNAVVYEVAPKSEFDNIYQHDGATVFAAYCQAAKAASVFEITGDSKQLLEAVSFALYSTEAEYTISIYKTTDEAILENGELLTSVSGSTTYEGYYTVKLDNPVELSVGDTIAIVIDFTEVEYIITGANNYTLIGEYDENNVLTLPYSTVYSSSEEGQSYIWPYVLWDSYYLDMASEDGYDKAQVNNVCIKAFTTDVVRAPENVAASTTGRSEATITWDKIDEAVGYEVWIGATWDDPNATTVQLMNDSNTHHTSYVTDITLGNVYFYKVAAIYEDENAATGMVKSDYSSFILFQAKVPPVKNGGNNDNFYQRMTFKWDALGSMVDGYVLEMYKGSILTDENKIDTIVVEGGDVSSYVYDTSAYEAGTTINYCVYAYIKDGEDRILSDWYIGPGGSTKSEPLDVAVKWHVTTIENVDYLVIDVEEVLGAAETAQDELCLWYCLDASASDPDYIFPLDMSDGKTQFMYTWKEHYISYKDTGYVYLTNGDKTTAFQDDAIVIGGAYVEPVLEPISDVTLTSAGQVVQLQAVISNESQMENFNYSYQWYVAADADSVGNAIEGATASVYEVKVGSFDEKFYYCEVTAEYPDNDVLKHVVTTTNDNNKHTRVKGELFGTQVNVAPIANQVYTGQEITPDIVVTDKNTGNILEKGTHYNVSFSNNTNVGTAVGTIEFIGDYKNAPSATVYFDITPKSAEGLKLSDVENVTYTGQAFTPDVTVEDETRAVVLTKGIDYEITYNANVNAGTAVITLDFKGNYTGTRYINFKILQKSAAGVTISNNVSKIYTGKAIIPDLILKDAGKTLTKDKDYTLSCSNNINVGTASVVITFIGNYTGKQTTTFTITPKTANDLLITEIPDKEYTGGAIIPELEVVYKYDNQGIVLKKEVDYTAVYSENVNLGTANIVLTFKGNYSGTRTVEFEIVAKSAENLAYVAIPDQTYDGNPHEPELTIKNGAIILKKGTDYDVVYSNNVNVGTAKATVTFKGNYSGTKTLEYYIVPKSGATCTIGEISNYTYTGQEITPDVLVKDDTITLVKDVDYIVEYKNNLNAGEATVTVVFKGNYTGSISTTFQILPIKVTDAVISAIDDQVYAGKEMIPEFTVTSETLGCTFVKDKDYTVTGTNNKNVGEATLVVTFTGNYTGTVETTFTIVPKSAESVVISPIADQRYTGSAIKPELEIKDGNIKLVAGQDYTVEYKDNVNKGTASAIVSFTGNYTGNSKTVTFTIIDPIPTAITSTKVTVSESSGYISKITVGTTVSTLLSYLNEKEYVSIFDKNGSSLSGENMLATGMTAGIVDDGAITKRYTIVVTGDTNGDGKINITDMIAVKACTLKKSDLTGAYEKAGDVNGDGKINITDFIKVKATTLKKDTITGVSVY
ncbi:MAG: hypothetical protein IJ455_02905 [Agathobacter sp.]|nr:hypothetical protein [Agathobacter sp.]